VLLDAESQFEYEVGFPVSEQALYGRSRRAAEGFVVFRA
jgi:hypothetical protein